MRIAVRDNEGNFDLLNMIFKDDVVIDLGDEGDVELIKTNVDIALVRVNKSTYAQDIFDLQTIKDFYNENTRCPIIALTIVDFEMKANILDAGATAVMEKPFSEVDLVALAKALIRDCGPTEWAKMLAQPHRPHESYRPSW